MHHVLAIAVGARRADTGAIAHAVMGVELPRRQAVVRRVAVTGCVSVADTGTFPISIATVHAPGTETRMRAVAVDHGAFDVGRAIVAMIGGVGVAAAIIAVVVGVVAIGIPAGHR